jgi:DNA-binding transcriptional ArsR family regulator
MDSLTLGYASSTKKAYILSSDSAQTRFGVWEFDPGTFRWTELPAGNFTPAPRYAHSGVYLESTGRFLMFGGNIPGSCWPCNETWLYDPLNNTWKWVAGTPLPPPRNDAGLAYDPVLDRAVLFGGRDVGVGDAMNDTWIFDPSAEKWTQALPPSSPMKRVHPAMTFDADSRRVFLYGGGYQGTMDPAWHEYDVANGTWTSGSPNGSPPKRYGPAVAYLPEVRKVVAFGGNITGGESNDTWEFDPAGKNWSQSTASGPGRRTSGAMTYVPPLMGVLLFGGWGPNGKDLGTWLLTHGTVPNLPPRVDATVPADGSVGVPVNQNISVSFDRDMNASSVEAALSVWPASNGTFSWPGPQDVTFTPAAPAGSCTKFYVNISTAAKSAAGVAMTSPYSSSFVTEGCGGPAPQVLGSFPAPGATGVSQDSDVRVYFSVDMEPASTAAAFSISPSPGPMTVDVSGSILWMKHSDPFLEGATYTVRVGTGAKSAAGAPLPAEHSFTFTTYSRPIPRVLSISPANGSVNVSVNASVVVTFDQPMDPTSTAAALLVMPFSDPAVISVNGTVLTLDPSDRLAANAQHYVRVARTARSAAGVEMGTDFIAGFTTEFYPRPRVLSGSVRWHDLTPVSGAFVQAIKPDTGSTIASMTTTHNGSGSYRFILEQRQYFVRATLPDSTAIESGIFDLDRDMVVDLTAPPPSATPPPPPLVPPETVITGVGFFAGLGAIAAAYVFGGEIVKLALLLLPVTLYSRLRKERVLDHLVRGQIYGRICESPGKTYGELLAALKVGNGTLAYHLYLLRRAGLVRSEREGKFTRFFSAGVPASEIGAMISKAQEQILAEVEGSPGRRLAEVAESTQMREEAFKRNLRQLVVLGMVRLEGWGREKRLFPGESADPGSGAGTASR